jgi:multimeric flavodoxin WrbA
MTRLLALSGSPHRALSNTFQLIRWIVERVDEEGWESEIIHIPDQHIEYCSGCGQCLIQGTCSQNDDTQELQDKLLNADVIVLGSPVYFMQVTAQMKTFIDRTLQFGHRPCLQGKVGASVTVYAGVGSAHSVADYMNGVLRAWGASTVGKLVAYAARPTQVKSGEKAKAVELAESLIDAADGKLSLPEFVPNPQMRHLIKSQKDMMRADYQYWVNKGWIEQ